MKKLLLSILIFSTAAHADLPLTVDSLLADKNRMRLDTSLSYINQSSKSIADGGFGFVDLGMGQGILVPNPVSEADTNSDTLVLGLGLRYGINDKWEMGIKTNGVYHAERYQAFGESQNTDSYQLQDITLTTQYQPFNNHDRYPNTLLFAEVGAYDNMPNLAKKSWHQHSLAVRSIRSMIPSC